MTALQRVQSTQRKLAVGVIATALMWAIAAGVGSLAIFSAIDQLIALPWFLRMFLLFVGVAGGLATGGYVLWRGRGARSVEKVALWIEERAPQLEYALVTAIDRRVVTQGLPLEAIAARVDPNPFVSSTLTRGMGPAAVALIAALGLAHFFPIENLMAEGRGGRGLFSAGKKKPTANRLNGLRIKVSPPAYAHKRDTVLDDASIITALVGSNVTIEGPDGAEGITANLGGQPMSVAEAGGKWHLAFQIPKKPMPLMLGDTTKDRAFSRSLVVDPVIDAPPMVVLLTPKHDTVLAEVPSEPIDFTATAGDDIGLRTGQIMFDITAGTGEDVKTRRKTSELVRYNDALKGDLRYTVSLKALGLQLGELVSIHAEVVDGNDVTGPGIGISETRTIRIKRPGEDDSIAVDPAPPPPIDSTLISQRMLNMKADTTLKQQRKLRKEVHLDTEKKPTPYNEYVARSINMERVQRRIYYKVMAIIRANNEVTEGASPGPGSGGAAGGGGGAAGGGGNTPATELDPLMIVNHYFTAAADDMMLAAMNLGVAEVDSALNPFMKKALIYLDSARMGKKYYIRGIMPKTPLDLAKIRLTGKDKGESTLRTPVGFADTTRERLVKRFTNVMEMLDKAPDQALTELSLMTVDALSNPTTKAAGSALGEAIDAIRNKKDATGALLRARRALDGPPRKSANVSAWSAGW